MVPPQTNGYPNFQARGGRSWVLLSGALLALERYLGSWRAGGQPSRLPLPCLANRETGSWRSCCFWVRGLLIAVRLF